MNNNETIKLSLPVGYQKAEKTEAYSYIEAQKILYSRKRCRYTYALKETDRFILYKSIVRCPHCGKTIPQSPLFLSKNFYMKAASKSQIREFFTPQLSLLGNGGRINISPQYDFNEMLICQKCGFSSMPSEEYADIYISSTASGIRVWHKITSIEGVMNITWQNTLSLLCDFPYTETVDFNFSSGETQISLKDCHENVICTKNLTNAPFSADKSFLGVLFRKNYILKRKIKVLFEENLKIKIPFTVREISLCNLIFLTSFPGFEKSFYSAIPYSKSKREADTTFSHISALIRHPQCVMKRLSESVLPYTKSVKRIFAENPGLIFYIKECEALFKIFKNIDLMCQILQSKTVFCILSTLHFYPKLLLFYSVYTRLNGCRTICRLLISGNFNSINSKAIKYVLQSRHMQLCEQEKWKDKHYFSTHDGIYNTEQPDLSLPLLNAPTFMKEYVINNYTFKPLLTTADCYNAGKKLHNCLVDWEIEYNSVVALYKGDDIVAAVEISDGKIVQARQKNNRSIQQFTPLYKAIEKWKKIYNFSSDSDLYDTYQFLEEEMYYE